MRLTALLLRFGVVLWEGEKKRITQREASSYALRFAAWEKNFGAGPRGGRALRAAVRACRTNRFS